MVRGSKFWTTLKTNQVAGLPCLLNARLHRRFLSQQLDAIFVALKVATRTLCDVAQFVADLPGCASRVHKILTTVMTRVVVDKSTDHAKPHSFCFLPQYQR